MRATLPLLLLLFVSSSVFSQQIDFRRVLVVRKNHQEFEIPAGKKYCMKYLENGKIKKIKSFYIGASKDSIYFSSRNGKNETAIFFDEIQSIRKLSSSYRLIMGITAGATVVGTAAVAHSMAKGESPTSKILIYPFVGLSVFSLCTIPLSLITDLLSERNVKDGWIFSIQRR